MHPLHDFPLDPLVVWGGLGLGFSLEFGFGFVFGFWFGLLLGMGFWRWAAPAPEAAASSSVTAIVDSIFLLCQVSMSAFDFNGRREKTLILHKTQQWIHYTTLRFGLDLEFISFGSYCKSKFQTGLFLSPVSTRYFFLHPMVLSAPL